ncbi:MAG TPA: hypothetical protein VGM50_13180 [Gemmatimonadaceae bacterium]|jgi:tetratricopeptide (TPR) repeat protein
MKKISLQPSMHAVAIAYRMDIARRGVDDPFGQHDNGWLTVATLLGHAAGYVAQEHDADSLLLDASELAGSILRLDLAESDPEWIKHLDDRPHGEIVRLTERIEHLGALNLANVMYESLTRVDPAMPALDRGRLMANLGRVRRRLGRFDESIATYRELITTAKECREPELEARAFIGLGAVAQVRGDFLELRKCGLRAMRIAKRENLSDVLRLAYQILMVASVRAQDFSLALTYGWAQYEAAGQNQANRDEGLTNIGQVLADTGNFSAARAAFARVLTRPQPPRIGLPALGGLAVAAAHLRDDETLNWSANALMREVERTSHLWEVSHALLECAIALAMVGRQVQAKECQERAAIIAERLGYQEILRRAAELEIAIAKETSPQLSVELGQRARRVVRKVEALNPPRLPERFVLEVAA